MTILPNNAVNIFRPFRMSKVFFVIMSSWHRHTLLGLKIEIHCDQVLAPTHSFPMGRDGKWAEKGLLLFCNQHIIEKLRYMTALINLSYHCLYTAASAAPHTLFLFSRTHSCHSLETNKWCDPHLFLTLTTSLCILLPAAGPLLLMKLPSTLWCFSVEVMAELCQQIGQDKYKKLVWRWGSELWREGQKFWRIEHFVNVKCDYS